MVDAYEPYVRAEVAKLTRGGAEAPERAAGPEAPEEPHGLEAAIDEGRRWLETALAEMLGLPYSMQARGPLELFQEAMRYPTGVLEKGGYPPAPRDRTARSALPGDLYGLAPASSERLGEEAWQAHLAWGTAKAVAMTNRSGAGPL